MAVSGNKSLWAHCFPQYCKELLPHAHTVVFHIEQHTPLFSCEKFFPSTFYTRFILGGLQPISTPWTGRQSITWPTKRQTITQPHTHP